jgi:uncharacterized protein YdhG (YjbR/CyaY superfamily)
MADTKKRADRTSAADDASGKFTADEVAAMKERAKELKAAKSGKVDGATAIREKLAEMPEADRVIGERINEIVTATAPGLEPRLYYGMPAYSKDGKVLCFFQAASKFKVRYATFGFETPANLDDGNMWPTAFAVTKLTAAEEKRLAELVKKAVS